MEILALLLLFQIKHWFADFKIQTYQQTVRKGIYRDWVGISHSIDHTWTSLLILLLFSLFVPVDPIKLLFAAVIEGILHYHIDWFKVRYGSKDMTKPSFWSQFGLDQLAHQITYLAIVWYVLLY